MDRRHAPERAVAHVERPAGGGAERGRERGGDVVHVRDDANPVAEVQLARLFRDVGRRVAVVQVRRQAVCAVLRRHAAGAVLEEAVDHDPVEAGHAPHLARRGLAEARQVGRRVQGGDGGPDPGEHPGGRGAVRSARLELEDGEAVPQMDQDLDFHAGRRRRSRRAEVERRGPRHDVRRPGHRLQAEAEELAHRQPKRRGPRAQQAGQVAGGLEHGLRDGIGDEQGAVRLDRARDVDRLAVAVREVERLHGPLTGTRSGVEYTTPAGRLQPRRVVAPPRRTDWGKGGDAGRPPRTWWLRPASRWSLRAGTVIGSAALRARAGSCPEPEITPRRTTSISRWTPRSNLSHGLRPVRGRVESCRA